MRRLRHGRDCLGGPFRGVAAGSCSPRSRIAGVVAVSERFASGGLGFGGAGGGVIRVSLGVGAVPTSVSEASRAAAGDRRQRLDGRLDSWRRRLGTRCSASGVSGSGGAAGSGLGDGRGGLGPVLVLGSASRAG